MSIKAFLPVDNKPDRDISAAERHFLDLLLDISTASQAVSMGEFSHHEFYNEVNRILTWGLEEYPNE